MSTSTIVPEYVTDAEFLIALYPDGYVEATIGDRLDIYQVTAVNGYADGQLCDREWVSEAALEAHVADCPWFEDSEWADRQFILD